MKKFLSSPSSRAKFDEKMVWLHPVGFALCTIASAIWEYLVPEGVLSVILMSLGIATLGLGLLTAADLERYYNGEGAKFLILEFLGWGVVLFAGTVFGGAI